MKFEHVVESGLYSFWQNLMIYLHMLKIKDGKVSLKQEFKPQELISNIGTAFVILLALLLTALGRFCIECRFALRLVFIRVKILICFKINLALAKLRK